MGEQGNGVSEWLKLAGIKGGEFQTITKPQLRSMQLPSRPLKVQVWATGMLHGPGFQGELATKLVNGRREMLTNSDITSELYRAAVKYYSDAGVPAEQIKARAADLRCSKHNMRRALAELEREGVCERRTKSGKLLRELSKLELEKLSNGQVQMYFWLQPKPPDTETVRAEWEAISAAPAGSGVDGSTEGRGSNFDPLPPPIPLILKVFQIGGVGKSQISTPEYQNLVRLAWAAAKKTFDETFAAFTGEGVNNGPPEGCNGGSPEGVTGRTVNTETKVDREEETKSSSTVVTTPTAKPQRDPEKTTTTPPENNPVRYASDRDELVALIRDTIGTLPDEKLIRGIAETLELRGGTLRAYLDDIRPRLARLRAPAGRGFFYRHAKEWGGAATTETAEPETAEQKAERTGPCKRCHNLGRIDGQYCSCRMGRDLERVERRKKVGGAAGGGSTP